MGIESNSPVDRDAGRGKKLDATSQVVVLLLHGTEVALQN